jgi:3D (Asp-Asp-Asp) domain-containing protein
MQNNLEMSKKIILVFLVLQVFVLQAQNAQSDYSIKEPTELANLTKMSLWATQYYIHRFQSGGSIPLVLSDGTQTGLYADTCDFCTAALEGTAFVQDSLGNITILNFDKVGEKSVANCRSCSKFSKSKLAVENFGKVLWKKSEGYGDGVLNYKLVPFRTIAVDKSIIPFGTVIFIPKVKGKSIILPNGLEVMHDGYFFAGDTGSAIKENHIDIFTGIFNENPFKDVIQSNPDKTFDAYVVKDQQVINSLKLDHIRSN